MKIGLICPYSLARGGGVQEIVRAMRVELARRGHDVRIITPQPREIDGVDTEGIIFVGAATDFRSPLGTTSQVSASADNEALEQMLETEKFDILHFHEPWVPFLSRQIVMRSGSVNIATFHAKVPENITGRTIVRVVTPYTKPLLKYMNELTAVSESASEYISSLTDQPITIIPNGIDLTEFKPRRTKISKNAPLKILFIGRLERRKGLKYLMRAYSELCKQLDNVELVIAGNGPDREKLELLARELQLQGVTFLGYVDDATKKELLAEADLFCAPAIYGESFGIVLLEAMACGVPVVAGNNSGYEDVMQDFGQISLVNPHDTSEFARSLKLLLTQHELRSLWKKWALDYVKQFDYPNVVSQYEDLYVSALAEHAKSLNNANKRSS